VTEQIDTLDLNTSISQMMIFTNELSKYDTISKSTVEVLVKLLSPFAPHISEELWRFLKHSDTISYQPWPKYENKYLTRKTVVIPIQINGKIRDKIEIYINQSKEEVLRTAKESKNISKYLKESEIIKEIYVPNRIINFVVK
ncbi:MAG: class I tRNA ligase family protein, partial [Candidatus Marinimicrobia bacterium]|nr:class I tRNA ligase family protein [Candidatus Neomarinimicrobiota bacterium]